MRCKDLGDCYIVYVSKFEVWKFNQSWPCSTLEGPQSFTFDKRNGDLVDRSGKGDGGEAVALSQDAQSYAVNRPNKKKAKP